MICEATSDWYEYISCINYAEKRDFSLRCDDGEEFSQLRILFSWAISIDCGKSEKNRVE